MRKIRILTPGPIRAMGMVHGPILTPYEVDDNKLAAFHKEGLNVVEVTPDGDKPLNLNDVIGIKPTSKKTAPAVKAEVKVEEPIVKEATEEVTVEEAPSEELTKEEAPEEITHKSNKKNKRK